MSCYVYGWSCSVGECSVVAVTFAVVSVLLVVVVVCCSVVQLSVIVDVVVASRN